MMATLNPGDEVIIAAPYWVSYPDIVKLASGTPIIIKGKRREIILKLVRSDLEENITEKTKWIIINSPSNPTGEVYSQAELTSLSRSYRKASQIYMFCQMIFMNTFLYKGSGKFSTIAAIDPE